jgi:hypothetical protein
VKTLTWLLDRNLSGCRARRVAGRSAVALTGAGAAIALAGPALAAPAGVSQALNGVVEISPNDAWAVGNTTDITGFVGAKPIAIHWNGIAWSVSTLPDLGTGGTLASVTASSATSVWAAGSPGGTTSVLHWNGQG